MESMSNSLTSTVYSQVTQGKYVPDSMAGCGMWNVTSKDRSLTGSMIYVRGNPPSLNEQHIEGYSLTSTVYSQVTQGKYIPDSMAGCGMWNVTGKYHSLTGGMIYVQGNPPSLHGKHVQFINQYRVLTSVTM